MYWNEVKCLRVRPNCRTSLGLGPHWKDDEIVTARKLLLYFESGCNGSVTGLKKDMKKLLNYSSIRTCNWWLYISESGRLKRFSLMRDKRRSVSHQREYFYNYSRQKYCSVRLSASLSLWKKIISAITRRATFDSLTALQKYFLTWGTFIVFNVWTEVI